MRSSLRASRHTGGNQQGGGADDGAGIAKHEDRVYTDDLGEAVERASSGDDRVVVTRGDEPLVAVISVRELQLLEKLEDERDLRALHQAEAEDDGTRIPWEDVKADAGP